MRTIVGPLTWAYCIIIAGIMIVPGGITPIVTNPALRLVLGVAGVVLGIAGFVGSRRQPALG
jgi:hypothetical protein